MFFVTEFESGDAKIVSLEEFSFFNLKFKMYYVFVQLWVNYSLSVFFFQKIPCFRSITELVGNYFSNRFIMINRFSHIWTFLVEKVKYLIQTGGFGVVAQVPSVQSDCCVFVLASLIQTSFFPPSPISPDAKCNCCPIAPNYCVIKE